MPVDRSNALIVKGLAALNFKNIEKHLPQINLPFHLKHWKWVRLSILISVDVLLISLCYWSAFVLRLEALDLGDFRTTFIRTLPIAIVCNIFSFVLFGMYRQVWRYANVSSAVMIGKCLLIGVILMIGVSYFIEGSLFRPRSVPAIFMILSFLAIMVTKFSWRFWVTLQSQSTGKVQSRCLIYGAGMAGELFARHAASNPEFPYKVVGFVDDDPNKSNRIVHGLKILGTGEDLEKFAIHYKIDTVIVALHAVSGSKIREIFQACKNFGLETLVMPDMANALDSRIIQPRRIDIKDLLRRSIKSIDLEKVRSMVRGKTILVTGAGGSIGSEICRQVLETKPKTLVLADASEFNLYKIDNELREKANENHVRLISALGSVADERVVKRLFFEHAPHCVLHAAAYKHVPLLEANPVEGILNNILSTRLLSRHAALNNAERFLLISSDKAVRPVNVMGSTKRVCELIVQAQEKNLKSQTKFTSVRFGNVLGSSGSVIPLFLEQIQNGGPVTVTHRDMRRYFMLTSEAVSLVLQSLAMCKGGEVFILDMGESVNIYEMAKQLISLAGKQAGKDIEIDVTGLRPGEKLFEELILEGTETKTSHDDIFIARPQNIDSDKIFKAVDSILEAADENRLEECLSILHFTASSGFSAKAQASPTEASSRPIH